METHRSLIDRLRDPDDHPTWMEFYKVYWEVVVRYGRKLGLSEADAHDVLQETMVALVRILPGFRYDPALGRFRNFLLTIVHRKALAALRRAARRPSISLDAEGQDGGTPLVDRLPAPPAAEPGAADRERWRQAIVEKALGELRSNPDIGERTLAVFEAYGIRSRPCAEVAATFGIKENAVYQIRNRLLRQLQVAVRRLAEDADPAGLPPPA